jgi:hypothetical protein
MDTAPDYIPEIEKEINSKSRGYPILLWATTGYLLLVAIDLFMDLRNLRTIPPASYAIFSIFLLIPAAGTLLLKLKKKIGWVTCIGYFEFMSLMLSGYLVQKILSGQRLHYPGYSDGRPIVIFGLSSMIIIFLLSKDIRTFLVITQKMLVWTLMAATLINLTLVVLILKR